MPARRSLHALVTLLVALALTACGSAAAPSGGGGGGDPFARIMALPADQRQQALVDGARAEGAVTFYNTTSAELGEGLVKGFMQKYPFIKAESIRLDTAGMLQRIMTEHAAGKQVFDVLDISGAEMYLVQQAGILARYDSPERQSLAALFRDEQGYFTTDSLEPEVFGFNTRLVARDRVPTTFEGLADPAWQGKVGRTTLGARWMAAMDSYAGADKAAQLEARLAKQNLHLYSSNSGLATALSQGDVTFDLHQGNVEIEKKKGAPVDFIYPKPLFIYASYIAAAAHAPHPYAAMLFVDYDLSRDGQQVVAGVGQSGPRADVTYPGTESLKDSLGTAIMYSPILLGPKYGDYQKRFEDMFVRKGG